MALNSLVPSCSDPILARSAPPSGERVGEGSRSNREWSGLSASEEGVEVSLREELPEDPEAVLPTVQPREPVADRRDFRTQPTLR